MTGCEGGVDLGLCLAAVGFIAWIRDLRNTKSSFECPTNM
jgi:hypothetical protein